MTPEATRRVAAGAIAAMLRAQNQRVRAVRVEHGRTSPQAKQAVARLDELREAYGRICCEQSAEHTARNLLAGLVDEWRDTGEVSESSLRFAAGYLQGEE
jgi:hypothetical protein